MKRFRFGVCGLGFVEIVTILQFVAADDFVGDGGVEATTNVESLSGPSGVCARACALARADDEAMAALCSKTNVQIVVDAAFAASAAHHTAAKGLCTCG